MTAPRLADFVDRGTCTQIGGELFFADSAGDPQKGAKRVCVSSCPVVRECFDYAMSEPELEGVWAGTSFKQRFEARSARAQKRSVA